MAPQELHTRGRQFLTQALHERLRRQVGVHGVADGPGSPHRETGLTRLQGGHVEHFGAQAQRLCLVRQFRLLVQRVFVAAQHVEAVLAQREAVLLFGGPLLVATAAEQRQVAQREPGGLSALRGGRAQEVDTPAQQFQPQAGAQVDRPQRGEQGLQRHACHAGHGQRHEMAGDHHAGIAERTAIVAGSVPLHHGDAVAGAHRVLRCGQANDAAADDEDGFAHGS